MNKLLLDISIIDGLLAGHNGAISFLQNLAAGQMNYLPAISVITEMDLFIKYHEFRGALEELLSPAAFRIVPISSEIARTAAALKTQYPELHSKSTMIAATALVDGCTVITATPHLYKPIPGLIVLEVPK